MLTTLVCTALGLHCIKTGLDIVASQGIAGVKGRVSTAVANVKTAVKEGLAEAEAKKSQSTKAAVIGDMFQQAFDAADPETKTKMLAILQPAEANKAE